MGMQETIKAMNETIEHLLGGTGWDVMERTTASTSDQRRALYRMNIIQKDVVKQFTKEEASFAIDFCIRLKAGNFSNSQPSEEVAVAASQWKSE